jgi:hypothetical protein
MVEGVDLEMEYSQMMIKLQKKVADLVPVVEAAEGAGRWLVRLPL